MTRPFAGVERFFERLFERPAARLFRAQLQPIQLERRLERSMESGRVVDGDTTYVPNRYHVTLNPVDLRGFDALRPRLEADLSDALRARARSRGYRLLGRPAVVLAGSRAVDPGDIQVSAEVIDPGRANGARDRLPRHPAPPIAPVIPPLGAGTPWPGPMPASPVPWREPSSASPVPWPEPLAASAVPGTAPIPASSAAWSAPPQPASAPEPTGSASAWAPSPLGHAEAPPPSISTHPLTHGAGVPVPAASVPAGLPGPLPALTELAFREPTPAPAGPEPAPAAPPIAPAGPAPAPAGQAPAPAAPPLVPLVVTGPPRAVSVEPAPEPVPIAGTSVASQPAAPFAPAPTARPSATATAHFAAPRYPGPMARIVVRTLAGPAGSHMFSGGAARVGRSSDNDIVLADERVSRHHGQFTARQGMLVYTDLGSTNGSFVNGTRAREIVLGFGDIVRLGNATLTIEPTS